jgi:tetratricopeptide (TPR) repeat protein
MSADTARVLHERALGESERGRHQHARRLLSAALRAGPEPAVRARILVSAAYHEAERHSLADGLAVLTEAEAIPGLPQEVRALVNSQRGLLRMRAGEYDDALGDFDATLRLLDESTPEALCRALLNREVVHEHRRNLAAGRADLTRCIDVAGRHGLEVLAAKAGHNLGCLYALAGDLPAAMRQLDAMAPVLISLSGPSAAVHHLDRSRVLVAAGLTREADADLERAVDLFGGAGIRQDQAEAELARAQVAVAEERWPDAVRLATSARRRFTTRGAGVWVQLAELTVVTAKAGGGHHSARLLAGAHRLVVELAAAGLAEESRQAALIAAAVELRSAGPAHARATAGAALRLRHGEPTATRMLARAVRAALSDAERRPAVANAERRAALRDLHQYQALFGSLDLQTAVSGLGRRLAEDGLARALSTGRPAPVFEWAERARALSTRLLPVTPPADARSALLLEELRQIRAQSRELIGRGGPDQQLQIRRIELERAIRQRSWQLAGDGRTAEPVALGVVRDHLAPAAGTLVVHLVSGGRLFALVLTSSRKAVHELGPLAPVRELHRRAHADIDVLASQGLPAAIRANVGAASRVTLVALDELLFGPVRRLLGEGPLLLNPGAGLMTVPWTLLPTAAGRPVTVVPSVTSWANGRARARLSSAPAVALVAGPRIERGPEELQQIASVWPGAMALTGREATAERVRAAAADADVLHIAAHGVHEPDNPLFSHLELADGPLFGHEFDQLPKLPDQVVLSACDLGLADTRPGEETLGMVAALLHGGAGSVVAGVGRISDAAACRLAATHHDGLRRGLGPAAALAGAMASADEREDPVPLVAFGAGW